jgi:hypothetical protein
MYVGAMDYFQDHGMEVKELTIKQHAKNCRRAMKKGEAGEAENDGTLDRQKLLEQLANNASSSSESESEDEPTETRRPRGKDETREEDLDWAGFNSSSDSGSPSYERKQKEKDDHEPRHPSSDSESDKEDQARAMGSELAKGKRDRESSKAEVEGAEKARETTKPVKKEGIQDRRKSPRRPRRTKRTHEQGSDEDDEDDTPRWKAIIRELAGEDNDEEGRPGRATKATKRQLRDIMWRYHETLKGCEGKCSRTSKRRDRLTEWRCANPGCTRAICDECKRAGAKVQCRRKDRENPNHKSGSYPKSYGQGKCSWFPLPDTTDYTYDSAEVGKFVFNKFDTGLQKGVIAQANGHWYLILWDDGLLMEVEDVRNITRNYSRFRELQELPTRDEFTRGSSGDDEENAQKGGR